MKAYIPFDPRVHRDVCADPLAKVAKPAKVNMPSQESQSLCGEDVDATLAVRLLKCAKVPPPVPPPRTTLADFSTTLAADAPTSAYDDSHANPGEYGTAPPSFSNFSRFSRDVSPHTHVDPLPLTMRFPCILCSGCERWDHHGIWRCVACWPPAAFTPTPGGPLA